MDFVSQNYIISKRENCEIFMVWLLLNSNRSPPIRHTRREVIQLYLQ